MTGAEIGQATINDLEILLDWRITVLKEVFADSRDADFERLREENRRYYASALTNGGHIACFATVRGKIVGCGGVCLYEEMPSPDNESGKCGYLMNVYVAPAYRRRGVGRQIASWLAERAKERGAQKIYLETSAAAQKMYASLGFSDMKGYMKL